MTVDLKLELAVALPKPKRRRAKPVAVAVATVDVDEPTIGELPTADVDVCLPDMPRKYQRLFAGRVDGSDAGADDDEATAAAFAEGVCCDRYMRLHDEQLTTVGGLAVVGGIACDVCGKRYIAKGVTREATAVDDDTSWSLAKGGMSINCGGMRLRFDGKGQHAAVVELMARIVRLPELEAEVIRLQRMLAINGEQSREISV